MTIHVFLMLFGAALFAVGLGIQLYGAKLPATPIVEVNPGPSPSQVVADQSASTQIAQAQASADAAAASASAQHEQNISKNVDDLKTNTDKLEGNPDDINKVLIDTGKQVRTGN